MTLRRAIPIAALTAAAGGLGALADPPRPGTTIDPNRITPRDMRHVESGRSDSNPMIPDNRVGPADLRVPNDFRSVFQVRKEDSARYGGWFARARGGLVAAFPRSQFMLYTDPKGKAPPVVVTLIPTNTIFFIGGIPRTFLDRPQPPPSGGVLDTSMTTGIETAMSTAALPADGSAAGLVWKPSRDSTSPVAHKQVMTAEDIEAAANDRLRQSTLRIFTEPGYRESRLDALLSGAAMQPVVPGSQQP